MTPAAEGRAVAPIVSVQFDRADRRYQPGDPLTVRYRVDGLGDERIRAVEHSILWYTEGKGEEDLGVHFFQRIADAAADVAGNEGFHARLPCSPLSYEGVIVKVRWCARVRIFFTASRDFVSEHVFEVGDLPPARLAGPEAP